MTDASKSERELLDRIAAICRHRDWAGLIAELSEITGMKLVLADAVVLTVEDAEQIERIATLPISTHARLVKAITKAKEKDNGNNE